MGGDGSAAVCSFRDAVGHNVTTSAMHQKPKISNWDQLYYIMTCAMSTCAGAGGAEGAPRGADWAPAGPAQRRRSCRSRAQGQRASAGVCVQSITSSFTVFNQLLARSLC